MTEMKKLPAIRFKRFSEEWQVHELISGATKIGDGLHGTPQYVDNGGVHFINGNNLNAGKINITNETKQVLAYQQSNDDKALDENTILMSINGTIGNLAYYQGENVMLGKSVAFISLSHFDKTYIYFYLQTKRVTKHFSNSLTGSTIQNLGLKTIRETDVYIPREITEQTQIGSYFQHLDKLISLHQTTVNKLTNLKKAMLEKMFPKQGADVPEIRFKGFEKAWDEKTVGGIFDDLKGTGLSKEKIGNQGKYKCILYGHLFTKFSEVIDAIDSRTDYYEGVLSKENDILMPSSTTTTGIDLAKASSLKESGVLLGGDIIILRMKEQGSSDFFAYYLTHGVNKKIAEVTQGTTIIHLYFSGLKDVLLKFPCPAEQALIGAYFQNLDKTIALHQTELEKLNNLKKACLEKMFV